MKTASPDGYRLQAKLVTCPDIAVQGMSSLHPPHRNDDGGDDDDPDACQFALNLE